MVAEVTLVLNQITINVDGKWVRLSPGMSFTAETKTGPSGSEISGIQQAAHFAADPRTPSLKRRKRSA